MKKENVSDLTRSLRQRIVYLREKGFTILEVLVAFTILAVIMAGMGMALTASMRLGSVQKQRSAAQDVTREVISSYVKSEDYWVINPFFNADETLKVADVATYGESNPIIQLLYDGTVEPDEDNLASFIGLPGGLAETLQSMYEPKLEILYTPIKKTSTEYYTSQVNVLVRLTFSNGKTVEMPTVVGFGDITRAEHALLKEPEVKAQVGQDCGLDAQDPTNFTSGVCCSGYTLNAGTGLCEVDSAGCGGLNLAPVSGLCCTGLTLNAGTGLCETSVACGNDTEAPVAGVCCTGTTLNAGTGLCETDTTCGNDTEAPVAGVCCTGTTLNAGTGLCETDAPTCGTVGLLPVSGVCCSGLFEKPSTGFCTTTPTCTPLNELVADNNNATCCTGLDLSAGTCITPTCTSDGSTAASSGDCCNGGVLDKDGLAYCGAACLPFGAPTSSKSSCCSGDWTGSNPKTCTSP